jgi:hypothetical protein
MDESASKLMMKKYEESIQTIYEDAKRRHVIIYIINMIVEYPKTNCSSLGLDCNNIFRI